MIASFVTALLLSSASSAPGGPNITVAAHDGHLEGDQLVWSTRAIVDRDCDLAFLEPLPASATVTIVDGGAPGGIVHDEDGRIVAVSVNDLSRPLSLTIRVPFDRGADRLPVPLFGADVERLTLDGLRFDPDRSLGVANHVGYRAVDGVGRAHRHRVEQMLRSEAKSGAIYLMPSAALVQQLGPGLRGAVVVVADERGRLAILAFTATAALAAALALVYRRLRAAVEEERVDKVLGGELDAL